MFWPHLCRHGVTEKFLACGPPPLEALLLPTYGPVWGEVEEGASGHPCGESAFACDGAHTPGCRDWVPSQALGLLRVAGAPGVSHTGLHCVAWTLSA